MVLLLNSPHNLSSYVLKCLAFFGSQLTVYYKGNWLHSQPSVNISLLPTAKRIYSPRAVSEHTTLACRHCKIKGHTHESENQSPQATAIALSKARRPPDEKLGPSSCVAAHAAAWLCRECKACAASVRRPAAILDRTPHR